jgi:hypothetical protein
MPIPASSPWIRRYPHDSFSRASRSTADRTLRCVAGRPERPWRDRRAQRGARGPGASARSCRERRSIASPPAAPPGPSPRALPATTHTGRRPARVPAPHPDRAAAGRSTRSPGVCREPADPIKVDAMPGSGIYLLWGTEDGTPAVGTRAAAAEAPPVPGAGQRWGGPPTSGPWVVQHGTRRVAQPRRQSPL